MVIRDTEIASRSTHTEGEQSTDEVFATSVATLTKQEADQSISPEVGEVEIPPTPVVKTALLTAVMVLTTLIELGVSVAIVAAIAFALQTLVR